MFKKEKYRFNVLQHLFPYTKGVRKFWLLIFVLNLFSMLFGFITPHFYRIFINDVILRKVFDQIYVVLIGYLGIFVLNVVIGYLKNYAQYTLNNHLLLTMKKRIFTGYFHRPLDQYDSLSVGDMKMNIEDDTAQIRNFTGYQSLDYWTTILTFVCSLVLLITIDWRLSLFSVLTIPITIWADHTLSRKEAALNESNRENDQQMYSWLSASIQGWREIRALHIDRPQNRRFLHYLINFARYYSKWINYWTSRALVIPKIKDDFFMRFGLYFLGGLLIIRGDIHIGDLLVFASYYGILSNAMRVISTSNAELQANMPLTDRLLEQLTRAENHISSACELPSGDQALVLENVHYRYPGAEEDTLHGCSLMIKQGEKVAISGPSGCGKTTLIKLIAGMLTPTQGKITYGGEELKHLSPDELYTRMGIVMQETYLFNASIRENMLYGKADASDKEIYTACEKANIASFIAELPEGLDTMIGEGGIKLSGGQRQRIVLARMFLRNADIYILDEATSSLDIHNETEIYDAIHQLARDKTVIIISHRSSALAHCDRIIDITPFTGGIA